MSNKDPDAVAELTADMTGLWMVKTQGSEHLWDLDAGTMTRLPGPRSGLGLTSYDGMPQYIDWVEQWPKVGKCFLVFFNEAANFFSADRFHRSSKIRAITRMRQAKPKKQAGSR